MINLFAKYLIVIMIFVSAWTGNLINIKRASKAIHSVKAQVVVRLNLSHNPDSLSTFENTPRFPSSAGYRQNNCSWSFAC